jgi:hypothetical protein
MRVLLSTYGRAGALNRCWDSRCSSQALGAEIRVCAPPDEECDASVATGVMPTGVWR